MKINLKTLCVCLALVTYAGITVAEGYDSSSYKDRGKSEPQTAAEWKAEAMKYKAKYKKLKNALRKELSSSTDSLDSDNDSKSETKKKIASYKMTDKDWEKWNDAAIRGDIEVIQSFINKEVDVDETRRGRGTALWYAAANCHADIIKLLVNEGADVNFYYGDKSVLAAAVSNTNFCDWNEGMDLLLDRGADPNKFDKTDSLSYTPLMKLASSYYWDDKNVGNALKSIEKLLANGADINLQDHKGKTALDYAEKQQNEKIAEFLRSKGAKKGSAQK